MDFINLWRNIFVGVAAVFLILTLGSYFLLNTQPQTLKERLNIFSINFERGEVVELKNSVKEFNNLVSAIHKVKGRKDRTTGILETIEEVTEGNEIIVDSINVPSEGDVISLSGRAPSHEKVIEFKNVLVNDSRFAEVKMPFSKIFTSEGNFANFEVSFKYNG